MHKEIVYISTEPLPAEPRSTHRGGPIYRCTIELTDGSTIMRCGLTEQHALANAIAIYKTTPSSATGERMSLAPAMRQVDGNESGSTS